MTATYLSYIILLGMSRNGQAAQEQRWGGSDRQSAAVADLCVLRLDHRPAQQWSGGSAAGDEKGATASCAFLKSSTGE
eukprot:s1431_g10.t1